jgi:hypothetical protein
MTARRRNPVKAYRNQAFLNSKDARALRILSEYLEPRSRFERYHVDDTVVFMGSARLKPREEAEAALRKAEEGSGDIGKARTALAMSRYYEAARELAFRLTQWSKGLDPNERRFVVCTGGGPGVMEAANRGAAEARGMNVGLTISIPVEEFDNPYVTRELAFHFHYFFMRKFWFAYLAKAVIVFPGGDAQDAEAPADRRLRHRVLAQGDRLRGARSARDDQRRGPGADASHRLRR